MEYKLIFRSGSLAGTERNFSQNELIVGRDPMHSMAVDDPKVSRDHLRIYTEDDQLFLVDLESTNGTFVNGKRMTKPTRLKNGDLVSVGDNTFSRYRSFPLNRSRLKSKRQNPSQPRRKCQNL